MHVTDTPSVASRIELAFQSASSSTGTSFEYLVKTAARESSFNPSAKARTSSATGLFQFIESTWLETMKEAGPKHGLDKYSDQILQTKSGKYYVKDPEVKREILDLRKDPEISSMMAGALTQKNAAYLERKIGREPTDGELYMAHFLGAHGASRLIDATNANPDMRADKMFSAQARANKPIFFHGNGKARSMQEVYEVIVSKHDAVTMIAQASGKTDLRTSGELLNVAALPTAKPVHAMPGTDPQNFDHLAGDTAASFAMRSKPPGPEELARMQAELPDRNPVQLAEATTSLPRGAETQNPAPQDPREASINPADPAAAQRVVSAFQATETDSPFEALFRNDQGSSQADLNPRFASAFAAVEEAGMFSTFTGISNQVAAQELALADQGSPLDLTRFLRLKAEEEQKDLLPPA
ncbi:transglycosylase SLT domain-containing protein [Roseibium sp.]|uniref:transglycosylase SLT domain-containing protein n=1 Tax=Roseibium sp. TaxID=1936156 RepID=UPI003B509054